jgi:hypothetical protein
VLFQQRTDSTERGILVKAARRVRVLDATPEHHLAPRRCGLNKRTLRREGKSSGSEGLLKSHQNTLEVVRRQLPESVISSPAFPWYEKTTASRDESGRENSVYCKR